MKTYPFFIGIVLLVMAVCSCDSKRDNGDKEAAALLTEARGLIASGAYEQARTLIDSLRSAYPRAFDARKEAIEVMNILEIKEAQHGIAVADSTLAALSQDINQLKKDFLLEKDPRYQTVGFYKDKQQPASSLHRTCLYAEVDETGQLFLVSVLNGKKLHHETIIVETGNTDKKESPRCFSFVTDNSNGYEEQASFKKGTDNGIVDFIAENSSKAIQITCKGDAGTHRYQLSKTDALSIARCNELERALQREQQLKHSTDSLRIKEKFFTKKQEKDLKNITPAEEKIIHQKDI